MGNQCCSATNTTSEQPTIAPIEPKIIEENEEVEATNLVKDETTPVVHNAIVEEVIAEQVIEDVEHITVVESYKFKNQLETLNRAMATVGSLKHIPQNGQLLTNAISEVEAILDFFNQSLHSTIYSREFKSDLIGLYGDLQAFRSFHLRYTLDENYFSHLNAITELFNFVQVIANKATHNNKLDTAAFLKELYSGEARETFDQLRLNLQNVRDQYNQISGQNFSTLPNYLYVTFNDQPGFKLWAHLFPNVFETSNVVFSQKYGDYCVVDSEKILEVISLLDNANDQRVDIYQWLHFVSEYRQVLDEQGRIQPEKLDQFAGEIESRARTFQTAPVLLEENKYKLQSGMIYAGQLDQTQKKTGQGSLTEEGYSLTVEFQDDLAEGHGTEQRKNVVYEGSFHRGLYHGNGTLTFPNGRIYKGAFENHEFHGEGVLTGDDGIQYQGIWNNGQLLSGKITYHDGSYYVGQISQNFFKNGQGSYYSQRPGAAEPTLFIEGTWENDTPVFAKLYSGSETQLYDGTLLNWAINGQGKRFYVDGVYEGSLLRDKKNGQGTLTYTAGDQFVGEWLEDTQVHGRYYFTKEKDHWYEGEWNKGVMQGKGKFIYASGGVYEGEIKDGKREGHGIYRYKNGNAYEGHWANNVQSGEGKFTYSSAAPEEKGDVYQGQFENGKYNGWGHYVYAKSGKHYIGQWEDDRWTGEGKFLDAQNTVLKCGVWKEDKLILERPESEVVLPEKLSHLLLKRASN